MEQQEILVCRDHKEYTVPLLGTYSFNYYEYWCPYCGDHQGMMGAGDRIKATESLIGRKEIYEEHSQLYLEANGLTVCSATMINEERVNQKDIPEFIKACAIHYADSSRWKLKVKASQLLKVKSDDNDFDSIRKSGEMLYNEGSPYVKDPFIYNEWEKTSKAKEMTKA